MTVRQAAFIGVGAMVGAGILLQEPHLDIAVIDDRPARLHLNRLELVDDDRGPVLN